MVKLFIQIIFIFVLAQSCSDSTFNGKDGNPEKNSGNSTPETKDKDNIDSKEQEGNDANGSKDSGADQSNIITDQTNLDVIAEKYFDKDGQIVIPNIEQENYDPSIIGCLINHSKTKSIWRNVPDGKKILQNLKIQLHSGYHHRTPSLTMKV